MEASITSPTSHPYLAKQPTIHASLRTRWSRNTIPQIIPGIPAYTGLGMLGLHSSKYTILHTVKNVCLFYCYVYSCAIHKFYTHCVYTNCTLVYTANIHTAVLYTQCVFRVYYRSIIHQCIHLLLLCRQPTGYHVSVDLRSHFKPHHVQLNIILQSASLYNNNPSQYIYKT